jgi:hypothetical protein
MDSSLALIERKTSTCWDESRSSSNSPVRQAPCLDKHCHTGRNLILFFKSFWSDLASTRWTATILPETDDCKLEINNYNRMQSSWIPRDIIPVQKNQVDKEILFRQYFFSIAAPRDVGSHRKMIVCADNAGPHVAKCVTEYLDDNSLKRAPHRRMLASSTGRLYRSLRMNRSCGASTQARNSCRRRLCASNIIMPIPFWISNTIHQYQCRLWQNLWSQQEHN